MFTIKRVLWVEDNERELNDSIKSLFVETEKKSVDSMQKAIEEISSERLYNYDTIVLDIDFRDDRSSNYETVISRLKERIYLNKDQCNEHYLKENGGYLLFLYLLERGYPSDRIAFLTGNQDIIDKLQIYTLMNRKDLSRDEIIQLFIDKWDEAEKDWERYEELIFNINDSAEYYINPKFLETEFVYACEDALIDDDIEKLKSLIRSLEIFTNDSKRDNGEEFANDMIFRFQKANLKSPEYFSKHDDDIPQHNLEDARNWIKEKSEQNKICRWLTLNASDHIEKLWVNNSSAMISQINEVLYLQPVVDVNYDFGIRNAFKQMFYVFDGLKAVEHKGTYYQAVSALLIPFEARIRNSSISDRNISLRRNLANTAKAARNYCAHNYFGSTISDQSTLFILMVTITVILNRNQRSAFSYWYKRAKKEIIGTDSIPETVDEERIDSLVNNLMSSGKIDDNKCYESCMKPLTSYNANDYLYVLGWHKEMKSRISKREKYYIFVLALHIIKVLEGNSDVDIKNKYGEEVRMLHDVSKVIVNEYNYSDPL